MMISKLLVTEIIKSTRKYELRF